MWYSNVGRFNDLPSQNRVNVERILPDVLLVFEHYLK